MTLQTPTYRPAVEEASATGVPVTRGLRTLAQRHLSKLVVAPSFAAILVFVYGFIAWTAYISFTNSRGLCKEIFTGPLLR